MDLAQPIYRQIVDALKRAVARGDLAPGDQIPSQRELAERLRVNPNTVQRAYREMEQLRLVETLRGRGTFVADNQALFQAIREEMAQIALMRFLGALRHLGFRDPQIIEMVVAGLSQGDSADPRTEGDDEAADAAGDLPGKGGER